MASEVQVRAVVGYDGTDFHGFQRQAAGRTVQGELEAALDRLYGQPVRVRGAGRTDAGVHARGQVIGFRAPATIPARRVALALGPLLPPDVAVRESAGAAEGFDPRRDAVARVYRYTLALDRWPDPVRDRFATRVEPGLDLAAMERAAAPLVGTHEFRSLCCVAVGQEPTRRTLSRLEQVQDGELVRLELEAPSFLYKQVRTIVGVLLAIGRGKYAPELTEALLAGGPRPADVQVAPPTGLLLERVSYE